MDEVPTGSDMEVGGPMGEHARVSLELAMNSVSEGAQQDSDIGAGGRRLLSHAEDLIGAGGRRLLSHEEDMPPGLVDEESDDEEEKVKPAWETHVFGPGLVRPMSFRYPDGSVKRYVDGQLVRHEDGRDSIDPVTCKLKEQPTMTTAYGQSLAVTPINSETMMSGLASLSEDMPQPTPAKHVGSCIAFGATAEDDSTAERHNDDVAKIIGVLGGSGVGRRAILKAVAGLQGISSEDELERLYEGKSESKLKVPRSLRGAMHSIGLGELLAPVNILTCSEPEQILEVSEEAWKDIEFEVALDSGSVVHVCSLTDCPGYRLGESPGSRRQQHFQMGDGGEIPNLGQSQLNLSDDLVGRDIQSVFQIAAATRPLMSVGRICDEGHSITFNNVMAVVNSSDGAEICRFHRSQGGLYVAKLKLRSPAGFGGPE